MDIGILIYAILATGIALAFGLKYSMAHMENSDLKEDYTRTLNTNKELYTSLYEARAVAFATDVARQEIRVGSPVRVNVGEFFVRGKILSAAGVPHKSVARGKSRKLGFTFQADNDENVVWLSYDDEGLSLIKDESDDEDGFKGKDEKPSPVPEENTVVSAAESTGPITVTPVENGAEPSTETGISAASPMP